MVSIVGRPPADPSLFSYPPPTFSPKDATGLSKGISIPTGAIMYFRGKGAVLLSLEGRIAFASTYFCDLVGVEHKEIAGMSCFDFVFPEDRDKALELVNLEAESTPAPFR